MKHLALTLLLAILFTCTATAQFELKTNPFGLIFAAPNISMEYGVREDVGLEANAWVIPDGEGFVFLLGKYYFNTREGLDRFNAGVFLGAGSPGAGVGFHVGQKIVSTKGLIFEFGIGAGRGFGDVPFIPYFKLDFGYRFKKKK